METIINVQPLENIISSEEQSIVVCLSSHPSEFPKDHTKIKSGFFGITSTDHFRQMERNLREELEKWMSSSSSTRMADDGTMRQMEEQPRMYHNFDECYRFITSRKKNSVFLILCDQYAQNLEMISEFKRCSQIARIQRCPTINHFDQLSARYWMENEYAIPTRLPTEMLESPICDLDTAAYQSAFMLIYFIEQQIPHLLMNDDKREFIEYCHEKYRNENNYVSHYTAKIAEFDLNYLSRDAIKWYTRSDTFIFRIVLETCGSLNFSSLLKIRFFLCDLYKQLQEQHNKQLDWLKKGIKVYRGVKMLNKELDNFKSRGQLFVTRNFLSTSLSEDVVEAYCARGPNDGLKESVLLIIKIDYVESDEKPFARIDHLSQHPDEEEVFLSMGMIFRVKSCKRVENEMYNWKVYLVRSESEVKLEKRIIQAVSISITGVGLSFPVYELSTAFKDHSQQSANLGSESSTSNVIQPSTTHQSYVEPNNKYLLNSVSLY